VPRFFRSSRPLRSRSLRSRSLRSRSSRLQSLWSRSLWSRSSRRSNIRWSTGRHHRWAGDDACGTIPKIRILVNWSSSSLLMDQRRCLGGVAWRGSTEDSLLGRMGRRARYCCVSNACGAEEKAYDWWSSVLFETRAGSCSVPL
jgi:hypothetical protein